MFYSASVSFFLLSYPSFSRPSRLLSPHPRLLIGGRPVTCVLNSSITSNYQEAVCTAAPYCRTVAEDGERPSVAELITVGKSDEIARPRRVDDVISFDGDSASATASSARRPNAIFRD